MIAPAALTVTSVEPITTPRNTSVDTIDFTFSEPIDGATLDFSDLTLTRNGGANLLTASNTVTLVTGNTYRINGLASLTGAFVAGLLLGVLQAFTDGWLTPTLEMYLRAHTRIDSVGALQQVVPYALLVLMLLLRPQGLFGRRGAERV